MQLLTESSGDLRDRQPKGGDDQCHWKVVAADILERGMHEGADRVHSLLPGHQAKRETDPRKIRGSQADEDRSIEH
eukprot:15459010-Heterocapsa_arctica.AAC.1